MAAKIIQGFRRVSKALLKFEEDGLRCIGLENSQGFWALWTGSENSEIWDAVGPFIANCGLMALYGLPGLLLWLCSGLAPRALNDDPARLYINVFFKTSCAGRRNVDGVRGYEACWHLL